MRWTILAALLLAGCAGDPSSLAEALVPAMASPLAFSPPVSTGLPVSPTIAEGLAAGLSFEPFVVADGQGRIFVADGRGSLSSSVDGGRTFVPMPGPLHERVRRSGDVALAIGPDDSLWYAQTFITEDSQSRGLHVAVSRDGGVTWPVNRVLPPAGQDRPWWIVAADRAHLTWTRIEGDPEAFVATSTDGGRTFASPVPLRAFVLGQGTPASDGSPLIPNCGGLRTSGDPVGWRSLGLEPACRASSPSLARSGAQVHVVFDDVEGRIVVASSSDDGRSWHDVTVASGNDAPVLRGAHAPHPWLAATEEWRAVAYYAEGEGGVDLVVARLLGNNAHRGVAASGIRAQNESDRPANTDVAALAALPDGRLVAAWAPRFGDIMVSVETRPPPSGR